MLVEASTGRYPYNANSGPVELMIQVRAPCAFCMCVCVCVCVCVRARARARMCQSSNDWVCLIMRHSNAHRNAARF